MAEKIYPASKPPTAAAAAAPATATANPTFPASKAHLYNNTRPVYRPQPRRSSRSRSRCCSCCLWITFTVVILVVLAAVAGGIAYVLYRPHRPSFSVTSIRVSRLNLTAAGRLTTRFDLAVAARNPNKRIAFYYDPVAVSFESDGVGVGDGTIPAFAAAKKNTTALRAVVAVSGAAVDDDGRLRSDLKSRKSLPLKIRLDTKVKAKIGSLKTKKVPIRVTCDGIKAAVPAGKTATAAAATSDAKCKVDLRIKIWKWTI